jgi:M6 family metalloprotease-like protein
MLSANAAAQAPPVSYPQPPPDFAHPSTPHPGRGEGRPSKFSYFGGNLDRPMLVIYESYSDVPFNPSRGQAWAQQRFFGQTRSVADFYFENSYGRMTLPPAAESQGTPNDGIVQVANPQTFAMATAGNPDGSERFDQQLRTVIGLADPFVNFAQFDADNDGQVTEDELVIVYLRETAGTSLGPPCGAARTIGAGTAWDGKNLAPARGAIGETTVNLMTWIHEVGHVALDMQDLYTIGVQADIGGGTCSWYDRTWLANAWTRMHLGWITPKVVTKDGFYEIRRAEATGDAYVLYDPSKGTNDYFVVENRGGTGYDADATEGLGVWRLDESLSFPADFMDAAAPGDMGTWRDGTPSNIEIRNIRGSVSNLLAYFDVRGPGIMLNPSGAVVDLYPGQPKALSVVATNTGEATDTFRVEIGGLPGPGWQSTSQSLTLGPTAKSSATLYLSAPLSAVSTSEYSLMWIGTSTSDPSVKVELPLRVRVHCTIDGTSGPDVLFGTASPDAICGYGGEDILLGGGGGDLLYGGAGNDTLLGGPGNDNEHGGDGDDMFDEGDVENGLDSFSGGAGTDTADYGARANAVGVSLDGLFNDGERATTNTPSGSEGDYVAPDIEVLRGGLGNDLLTGDGAANRLEGGDGDDALTGGDGDDELTGEGGADSLEDGPGDDTSEGGNGDDRLVVGEGADALGGGGGIDTADYIYRTADVFVSVDGAADDGEAGEGDDVATDVENVTGGSGNDKLSGSAAPNLLFGSGGADLLLGLDGDDRLRGGSEDDRELGGDGYDVFVQDEYANGSDLLSGEAGHDTVDYSERYLSLYVTLDGIPDDGDARGEGDNVVDDVEIVLGGTADDTLVGAAGDQRLVGGPGGDRLLGLDGWDELEGSAGDDAVDGGDGNDSIREGDAANGADMLAGGAGIDLVTYGQRTLPVAVAADGAPRDGERREFDNVAPDVENVSGGAGNDIIVGSKLDNYLQGRSGNDRLAGLDGADYLEAGNGDDVLDGGLDADFLDGGPGYDICTPEAVDTAWWCEA